MERILSTVTAEVGTAAGHCVQEAHLAGASWLVTPQYTCAAA